MTPPPTHGLTRAQVESLADRIADGKLNGYINQWLDTDAALRTQLDASMRRQETLAKNVNDGLLEVRAVRAEVEGLGQHKRIADTLMLEGSQKIDELRAQLAAGIEALKTVLSGDYSTDIADGIRNLAQAMMSHRDNCVVLEHQLAAQAVRIKELEGKG